MFYDVLGIYFLFIIIIIVYEVCDLCNPVTKMWSAEYGLKQWFVWLCNF